MWRAKERREREQAPTGALVAWYGLWTVGLWMQRLEGIGDLACRPSDYWAMDGMVEAGGLRDVKVARRGSPQMSLTKLKRRPPEARDP
jgi:hypothetical protein